MEQELEFIAVLVIAAMRIRRDCCSGWKAREGSSSSDPWPTRQCDGNRVKLEAAGEQKGGSNAD